MRWVRSVYRDSGELIDMIQAAPDFTTPSVGKKYQFCRHLPREGKAMVEFLADPEGM